MADRIGADDCGSNESNVSTRTSINFGAESSSNSSSAEELRRSEDANAFLQHMISSEAGSEYSPGRRSTRRSNWMSKYLRACNLFASMLSPQFLSCRIKCTCRMEEIISHDQTTKIYRKYKFEINLMQI